jgi:hypothetical protein
MNARGKFAFLTNKYLYVEKMQTALNDEYGYQELVIHALPMNACSVILLFFIFNKKLMKKASYLLSFAIFWIENIFFIAGFFLYEIFLIPVIYVKTFYRLTRAPSLLIVLKYSFIWFWIGIFVLLYTVLEDVINFLKILKIASKDSQVGDLMNNSEDSVKDTMVIVNEIADTMRILKQILTPKMNKSNSSPPVKEIKRRPALFDIQNVVESLLKQQEEESSRNEVDISDIHLIIRKELIIDAWKKYRPPVLHPQLQNPRPTLPSKILGPKLMQKIVDEANIYSTQKKNQDENMDDREDKLEFGFLGSTGMKNITSNSASQLFRINISARPEGGFNKFKKAKEKDEDFGYIPPEEIEFVEALLELFVIPRDTSTNDQIDIMLALK